MIMLTTQTIGHDTNKVGELVSRREERHLPSELIYPGKVIALDFLTKEGSILFSCVQKQLQAQSLREYAQRCFELSIPCMPHT